MYTVYGAVTSRTFRVLWALEELGQTYSHVPLAPRDPKLFDLVGAGKIPVFTDGDEAVTDSTAIMTYLADKHEALTHPAGTIGRARQDAMTGRVIDEFDALLWTAARHSFILPKDHRVPAVKDSLKWEFDHNAAQLGAYLADHEFLAGDAITIPDIILTHCLGWAIVAKFGVNDAHMSAYLDRMRKRDAYTRARSKAAS